MFRAISLLSIFNCLINRKGVNDLAVPFLIKYPCCSACERKPGRQESKDPYLEVKKTLHAAPGPMLCSGVSGLPATLIAGTKGGRENSNTLIYRCTTLLKS